MAIAFDHNHYHLRVLRWWADKNDLNSVPQSLLFRMPIIETDFDGGRF
jgi:hypothetical protein